jgi:hypothetical protein
MTRIVLDEATLALFPQSPSVIEVCDSLGNVRGVFQAVIPPTGVSLEPAISETELQARAQSPLHGRSLADIVRDLEART